MLSVIVMMFFTYMFSGCRHVDNLIVAMPTGKVQHCDYIFSNCEMTFLRFPCQYGCFLKFISEES